MQIIEDLKALKERMQTEGKEQLDKFFKDFMAANPGFTKVIWQQYTPYFNDGDTCTFSIRGVYFQFSSQALADMGIPEKEQADILEGEDSCYEPGFSDSMINPDGYWSKEKTFTKEQKAARKGFFKAMEDFESTLSAGEELLEIVLGDHVQVTLTPEGVEVEEYEHD